MKTIIKFLISTLEFVKTQSFIQNKKKILRSKNALLGQKFSLLHFRARIRILKFGTKSALFGCFRCYFEKLLSYLKSARSISLIAKFGAKKKKKSFNLGQKMPDLSILGLEFEHIILIFQIGTFEFVSLQNFVK